MEFLTLPIIFIVIIVIFLLNGVRVLREYERAVIFRLGRISQALVGGSGPGLIILIPGIDKMVKVPLRTVAMEVPTQDIITRDNVSVKVSAVIYFRVIDPQKAILQVENYLYATSQIAQTTLRSVWGRTCSMICCLKETKLIWPFRESLISRPNRGELKFQRLR